MLLLGDVRQVSQIKLSSKIAGRQWKQISIPGKRTTGTTVVRSKSILARGAFCSFAASANVGSRKMRPAIDTQLTSQRSRSIAWPTKLLLAGFQKRVPLSDGGQI